MKSVVPSVNCYIVHMAGGMCAPKPSSPEQADVLFYQQQHSFCWLRAHGQAYMNPSKAPGPCLLGARRFARDQVAHACHLAKWTITVNVYGGSIACTASLQRYGLHYHELRRRGGGLLPPRAVEAARLVVGGICGNVSGAPMSSDWRTVVIVGNVKAS